MKPIYYTPQQIDMILSMIAEGEPDECWLWQGPRSDNNYGDAGKTLAHIAAWWIANRRQPLPHEKVVRHLCGTKLCCNPSHLRAGTHKQNTGDAIEAGTMNIPHESPTFLPPEQKAEIVRRARTKERSGERQTALAAEYNVHISTIRRILKDAK